MLQQDMIRQISYTTESSDATCTKLSVLHLRLSSPPGGRNIFFKDSEGERRLILRKTVNFMGWGREGGRDHIYIIHCCFPRDWGIIDTQNGWVNNKIYLIVFTLLPANDNSVTKKLKGLKTLLYSWKSVNLFDTSKVMQLKVQSQSAQHRSKPHM